ncbi:MAG: 50S ribosomal protein L15 [Patescibacteria group bacterium]
MQLHQLKPKIKLKNKKRVGRGGKRGSFSGKGIKGQKAHAGRKIKSQIMELIQRLPKLRGFKNKSFFPKAIAVNVGDLDKKITVNIINKEALFKAGLIKKIDSPVKILSEGEIKRSLQIEGLKVSKTAKEKIEAAGGSIK